jgi:peptidoglycan/xylan/chitin deacetylase (PgdA/CDA1 family)
MRLLSRYVWRFSSSKKEIYLTFDDGPTEEITDFVLKELDKYNAKATFFCLGKNIQAHPAIFKKIKNNGHRVGNHTQQHLNGWKTNKEHYLENILQCEQIIHTSEGHHKTGTTRQEQKLFRPPYGKIKKNQTTALLKKDYKIVLWDVLSADFDKNISKEKCLKNVLENVQNGSIVVFHDSIKAREKVKFTLPIVLAELTSQGYIFKAI